MTDEKVVSLAERKAEKTQDSRDWTPLDCLEALVRDIKAGKEKPVGLCIHYWEEIPGGGKRHSSYASSLTYPEHIALLNVGLASTLERWRE